VDRDPPFVFSLDPFASLLSPFSPQEKALNFSAEPRYSDVVLSVKLLKSVKVVHTPLV
jgi:hypothetical protein